MTIAEAQQKTACRLKFGDPEQIKAVAFLAEVETFWSLARNDRWRLCPACRGDGFMACDCGDKDWDSCQMDALEACGLCDETGVVGLCGEPPRQLLDTNESVCRAIVQKLKEQSVNTAQLSGFR